MRIIEQLVYKITGDNSEFDRSIDRSEGKVNKFGSVADKMLAGVTVAAIGMVVKKVGDMVVATAQATDRVDKMSQKIGISRTAFQEWDFILSQSGASVDGLQMAVKTLSGAADEASKGTLQYKESFDRLGVSVTDINGNMKDQETLFNEVFSALANLDNQTERTAIANKLLGRSATELAPAFNAGGDAIEGMRTQAHELGLVMSDELVDKGVILTDNIDKLKRAYKGWKNEALEPLLGLAVTFTDKLLGQNTGTKNLDDSTRSLVTQSKAYKDILTQLKDPTVVLTDAERARLEILKGIQAQNLEDTIYQTNRAYKDGIADVRKAEQALADLEAAQAAYTLVTKDQSEAIKRRDELSRTRNRTDAETLELSKLNIALMDTEFQRQTELLSLGDRIGEQKEKANALNGATAESVRAVATAVEAETLSISQYALTSPDFYNAVMTQVDAIKEEKQAIEARNIAIQLAATAFKQYENASDEALKRVIEEAEKHKDSAYYAELHRLATEKLNERIVESGLITEKQTAILANNSQGMQAIEKYALALGDVYDANSEKASLLTSTIKALIDIGIDPESEAVADLVAQLNSLTLATEEATEALGNSAVEAFKKSAQSRADAYKEIDSYRQSDYSKEMQAIREKAEAFLKAGVEEVDVAKWQSEQWDRIHKAQADKAEEEAKRARDAWIDYAFDVGGSIASMWSSINQVQANQNQSEIQRIEEQNKATLESARLRGASEEELTELEKSLQKDLNDTKNQYAKEESERKKAQATFSAIIDTASAIIGFLANPGGWAGWALSAGAVGIGAAQIAAINSAPVPSYDVGSIRIPETTQAVVHKDEMILTAPQAEQARREGITIAPNKASGNSVNLVIYLDGKEIARNTINNINSGSVGTIKARVVK